VTKQEPHVNMSDVTVTCANSLIQGHQALQMADTSIISNAYTSILPRLQRCVSVQRQCDDHFGHHLMLAKSSSLMMTNCEAYRLTDSGPIEPLLLVRYGVSNGETVASHRDFQAAIAN